MVHIKANRTRTKLRLRRFKKVTTIPLMKSIRELLLAAGGYKAVAEMCGVSHSAVKHWPKIGIPQKHWDVFIDAAGATAEELHHATGQARARSVERAAS